ncbi:MAG: efflux RND transporter periplasmic adaptor subunit [Bacteroidaceae bacterium]
MKIYTKLLFIATLLCLSCGTKNAETEVSGESDSLQVAGDSATTDSLIADATTSATYKANAPVFNGVLTVSPTSGNATVSTTMGGKIHSFKVMQGSSVSQGTVIATLDNPEFIDLQQSYIDAVVQLEYLEKEYQRQKSLGSQEAASQKRVQQSKAEYLSMKSKAEAAAAQLKALGINPDNVKIGQIMTYLPVKSPISGYVTDISVNIGKYVDKGEAICRVVSKANLLIELTVYEKDINIINLGDIIDFRVNGMGKDVYSAKVISIDQSVDKEDYSIKVYAKVTKTNPVFRPGMYVSAKVRK